MMGIPRIYWKSILVRQLLTTLLLMGVLVLIFILIDMSENSDEFTDQGARIADIVGIYYVNYIPEMVRLILPLAVFVSTLFHAGRMNDRLEFTAYKAAGAPMRRLIGPFMAFALLAAALLSWMDANHIPKANLKRFDFEREYLSGRTERLESGVVFRQVSNDAIININFYDPLNEYGYQMQLIEFEGGAINRWMKASRMTWIDSLQSWRLQQVDLREMGPDSYRQRREERMDTTLALLPSDLSRRSSDIYQLTYREALDYLASMERLGIGHLLLPVVQFHGRVFYPMSIIIVTLIGFSISAGGFGKGRGVQIAAGLAVSFLYLTMMKVAEPFGASGVLHPMAAAVLPHAFFLLAAIYLHHRMGR